MNADQVGFTLHGVIQAELGKIAVAGIDIVQVDVFHRKRNHLVRGDVLLRQQDQRAVAEEILNVVDAEHCLHRDFLVAEIAVRIEDVGKADDLGHVLVKTGELVQHLALCHRKSTLPRLLRQLQRAGAEEGVEIGQHLILQRNKERLVGLFNRNVRAVFRNAFQRHALGILRNLNVVVCHRLDLHFRERNLVALCDSAALEAAVNACLIGNKLRAGCLADRTHNAENRPQRVPVVSEPGDEIHLTCGGGKLSGSSYVSLCSHKIAPFKSKN